MLVNEESALAEFLKAFGKTEKVFIRAFEPKHAPKKHDSNGNEISTVEGYEITLTDLPSQKAKLQNLNTTHGIYFLVNEGSGFKDCDIKRFNAVFVENDTLPIEEQRKRLDDSPLLPSIRVRTDKSIHAYWLLDGECSEIDWREIQDRLIGYFDGDDKIRNPARVMRMPFFNHVRYEKSDKIYKFVEVIDFQPERRYTAEQLLDVFPEVPKPEITLEKAYTTSQDGNMPEWYEELTQAILDSGVKKERKDYSFKCPICGVSPYGSAFLSNEGKIHCRKSNGKCKPVEMARAYGIDVDAYRKKYGEQKRQTEMMNFNMRGENFMEIETRIDSQFSSSNSLDLNENGKQTPVSNRAFYGLAGDIVRTIEPHTEADSMALLLNILVSFGNVIGRKAFSETDGTQQFTNLYGVLVGATNVGKGTSWAHIKRLFDEVDSQWAKDRITGGLSSGEGLVAAVRNDDGIVDKRLLVVESEFSSVLLMNKREGNTLSQTIRNFWDSGKSDIMTKNSPMSADNAHISIIGHITSGELLRFIDRVQVSNGYANRFLWAKVRRSKELPNGGKLSENDRKGLVLKLKEAVEFAQTVREMWRDEAASKLWSKNYSILTAERQGAFGYVRARGRAQVVRLSMIYALLDKSSVIRREHLEAAFAFWQYCEKSAREIFGDATGNNDLDKLIKGLKVASEHRLSRTEISRELFSGNKSASDLELTFLLAEQLKLAERFTEGSGKEEREFLHLISPNYELDEVDKAKAFQLQNNKIEGGNQKFRQFVLTDESYSPRKANYAFVN